MTTEPPEPPDIIQVDIDDSDIRPEVAPKPDSPSSVQDDDSESNSTCMICMEKWTIGSEHKLCCLKCGHLFGRTCIERWIKEKGTSAKCPTCNKAAKKIDIRDIWCKAIKATDNTELSQLQKQLESERKLRKTDSAVIFHQNMKLDMLTKDVESLKRGVLDRDEKITKLESMVKKLCHMNAQNNTLDLDPAEIDALVGPLGNESATVDIEPRELKGLFYFVEKIESSSTGGCKCFSICPTAKLLLVAQPAPQGASAVFGSFGLRKYSIIDTNVREFIPLHSKMITSIHLKPVGDLILSSSQDKKIKVTSITNNACIQTYNCQYDPVCVSWSTHRDNQFYVTTGNCYASLYDLRNTSECIYQTNERVARTRTLSMISASGPNNLQGLIMNDVRGSQFLQVSSSSDFNDDVIDRSHEHLTGYQLPFEGTMGTVDFDQKTELALITTRKSPVSPLCTHNLIKFKSLSTDQGQPRVDCKVVRSFTGGRSGDLLSHSRILKHPTLDDHVLVGACEDSARGIRLWDSSDNSVFQTIKTDLFIRDMLVYSPEYSNQQLLYTLSERGIGVYRWDFA